MLTTCFNCGFMADSDRFDIKTIVLFKYPDEVKYTNKCLCNSYCLEELHKKGWETKNEKS
jgi:hypothetical protein